MKVSVTDYIIVVQYEIMGYRIFTNSGYQLYMQISLTPRFYLIAVDRRAGTITMSRSGNGGLINPQGL